ncbi:MAG TPA: hypothetical protein VEG62_03210 [Acidimicrobiales bacterium]|nr:hypothetical protein [Acidimicrobiales bacterium]
MKEGAAPADTGQRLDRRRRRILAVLAFMVLLAWCGWVSGFHRTSVAAEITWACSVAAVVAVDLLLWRGRTGARGGWRLEPAVQAWPRPARGGARRALLGLAPWLVLALVAVTWDVLGLDTGPHQTHQTISALSQAYRPLNAGLLLVWMLVGVAYEAARVRRPARPGTPGVGTRDAGGAAGAMGVAASTLVAHPAAPALLLPQSPAAGVAFWVAVPVAAVLVDLVARRSDGRLATGEEVIRFISTPAWANVVLIAAWLFAGYHLFAR